MIIENSESLKNWLTSYLEPLCEADPQALAKYVMALIKKDRPEKELKSICFDQLEVFLQNQTVSFVEVLFETLNNKSYLVSNNSNNLSSNTNENLDTNLPLVSAISTSSSNLIPSINPSINVISSSDANSSIDKQTINPASSSSGLNNSQSSSSALKRSHHNRERSRSKSKSRSPSQAQARHRPRDVDMRRPQNFSSISNHSNTRGYFNEERLRRSWAAPPPRGSSRRYMSHLGGHKRSQPPVNRRSRSKSRSRSRSYSYSPRSSRSQSRSRSRSKSRNRSRSSDAKTRNKEEKELSLNKKYRPSSKSPAPSPKETGKEKESSKKRCRDYDEKGFCMRGDLCPYDHGKDPVVLDSNVSSVVLGFAANGSTLLPNIGHPINNAPPNSYLAEPYNPEAPGIDKQSAIIGSHPNQRPSIGPLNNPHRGPLPPTLPPPQFWGPMRAPIKPNLLSNHPASFIPQMSLPGRPRELVGVPTISDGKNNVSHVEMSRVDSNSNVSSGQAGGGPNVSSNSRKGRGGFKSKYKRQVVADSANKCTLEVRKIPSNLNTITNLNTHFSKFGSIVNLQICFEGDPEAALVQFTSHAQALAAYRCTEAVLNNRFIKVFWHSKDSKSDLKSNVGASGDDMAKFKKPNFDSSSNGTISNVDSSSRVSAKERLGIKQAASEKVTTALSSFGTISRTVFNPALLKKLYSSNNTTAISTLQTHSQGSFTQVKPESKKTKLVKKLELQRKRQGLLSTYVKEQKLLVEKLTNAKSEKEKGEIRTTVEGLEKQITKLEEELKKDAQVISTQAQNSENGSKIKIQKELLDVEMDFYNKLHKGETTLDLAKKLNELRVKAKSLGISEAKQAKLAKRYAAMRGSTRGRFKTGRGFAGLRKVDRRTRKILIPDIKEDDQIELLSYLAQLVEVETIDALNNGTVVTFKTRAEAEMALSQLSRIKFKDKINLKGAWFDEAKLKSLSQPKSKQMTEKEIDKEKLDNDVTDEELPDDELLLGVGMEDDLLEEEESDEDESRAWRR